MATIRKSQAVEAFDALESYPEANLAEIAREYAVRREIAARSKPLPELIAAMLAQKTADELRPVTIRDYRAKLTQFAAAFPNRLASSITAQDIDGWLRGSTMSPRSRNSYRLTIGVLFSWAKHEGFTPSNPVKEVRIVNARSEVEVPILSPADLSRLFVHALPRLRPYLAICAFAALRPAECQRLRWDNVHPDAIYVPKSVTKTVARRVPILPALATWLASFGEREGRVVPPVGTWKKDWEACRRAADLYDDWSQDALRHSSISFWLAIEPNRAAVALWSGNSEEVQRRHYENPRSPQGGRRLVWRAA